MKTKNDLVLTLFIVVTICLMAISVLTVSDVEQGFGGKARDVNMELMQKRILEKTLSDKEADFYEEVK